MGRRGTVVVEAITSSRVMNNPSTHNDHGVESVVEVLSPARHIEKPYPIYHSGFATLRFSILCVLAHRIASQEIGSKDAPRVERYQMHGPNLMKTAVPASLVA